MVSNSSIDRKTHTPNQSMYLFFTKIRNSTLIITLTLFIFSCAPFIFVGLTTSAFRTETFLISTLILAFSTSRLSVWQLLLLILVSSWVIAFVMLSEGSGLDERSSKIVTIGSTFIFSIVLYRSLEFNESVKALLLRYYIKLTGFLAICSILSVMYYLLFGTYFFSLPITTENYNYLVTPFGMLLSKQFFDIEVLRAFNYFSEPVFVSILFAGNFFLFNSKDNKLNLYRTITLIAGLLSFSYAYVILFLYFQFTSRAKKIKIIYLLLIFCVVLVVQITDLIDASSMSTRILLSDLFIDGVKIWDGYNWLFGATDYSVHFSAGLMQMIWDYGLIGLILYFLIIYVIARKNLILIGAVVIGSMIFDLSAYPFFYLMIIIFSIALKSQDGRVSFIK